MRLKGRGCCFSTPPQRKTAGIFSQPQGWLILAESLLGRGDKAFRYFRECSPAEMNDRAEIRRIEPYVHGQATEGKYSPNFGRSHVHWLTGTASTVMVGCVEGILGLRPTLGGIVICPAVPPKWKEFTMRKVFRGKVLNITVRNPDGARGPQGGNRAERQKSSRRFHPGGRTSAGKRRRCHHAEIEVSAPYVILSATAS